MAGDSEDRCVTHTPHAEVLQACRRSEDSVASSIKRSDLIAEISHSVAIVVVRRALVE
jgi:hypothetical protein